ncbi:MAG: hypothetical protein HYW27_03115 [Candidatus Aenigmarchaeota archaeon]|nr:hypothetical protein [Candidatus Aenigmarchaeota archaeon]
MKCILCSKETPVKIRLNGIEASFCWRHVQNCEAFLTSQKVSPFADMPREEPLLECRCIAR